MVIDEKEFERFAIEFAGLCCEIFKDTPELLANIAEVALNGTGS